MRALRARHGLDRPLLERYVRWLASLARGELGYSFAYGSPVAPLLWPRVRNTLLLTVTAMAVAWLLAVPLGVWWATRRRPAARHALAARDRGPAGHARHRARARPAAARGAHGLVPGGGHDLARRTSRCRRAPRAGTWPSHLVLPAAALVLGILPRAACGTCGRAWPTSLAAPFVRAARAHGIPERRVLFRHVLPAAANPLVSLFGLSLAGLLSMSLLVEVVMSWPGLGPLLLEAILARDFYLVLGLVLASTVLLVGGNMVADVAAARGRPAHPRGGAVSRRGRRRRRARAGGRAPGRAVRRLPRPLRRRPSRTARCPMRRPRGCTSWTTPGGSTCGRSSTRSTEDEARPRAATGRTAASGSRCASSSAGRGRERRAGSPAPLRRRRAGAHLPARHGRLRPRPALAAAARRADLALRRPARHRPRRSARAGCSGRWPGSTAAGWTPS